MKTLRLMMLFVLLIADSLVMAGCQVEEKEVTRVVTATPKPEAETAEESGTEDEAANEPVVPDEPDRGDILTAIDEAEAALEGDPDNAELVYELANLHYQAGYFQDAWANLQPLADSSEAPTEALMLMGDLEYLLGNYAAAEAHLQKVVDTAGDDLTAQISAQVKLLFVYYQTNQYAQSQDLLKGFEDSIELPTWDLMKDFDEPPYQIDWDGQTEVVVPFEITDPLPVISVEINGVQTYAFIDTGGDSFVLDTELAESLGIEPIATAMGTFAGGLQAEVGFARTESLQLGDVTLANIPVTILPTQRFSEAFEEGKYTLGGVVGTGVLRQFLSTIDYPNGQLVLRPRTEAGKQALQQDLAGKTVTEMPFALAATHMMMAKGSLNDKENLTFFVDSGLASDAAFMAYDQTLDYASIPVPETAPAEGVGGGGGADFEVGSFPIESLGLGTLIQEDKIGEYSPGNSGSYWVHGFIQDGLISHQFLRNYAWTLDFVEMEMIFAQ